MIHRAPQPDVNARLATGQHIKLHSHPAGRKSTAPIR